MDSRLADPALWELPRAHARVEPVLLGREELVLPDLPSSALGRVSGAALPRVLSDHLQN